MATSHAIGSAGELIAQARLIVRGWTVGNVNTGGMQNAPAIDLLAAKSNRTIKIAVKTTGHNSNDVQWNATFGWDTIFKGDVRPDFVIFIWFVSKSDLDACRTFVVPADVVDRDVKQQHEHWHANLKRDGSPRKQSDHVSISWLGKDTAGNISYDFVNKWSKFENAWPLLES